MVMLVLIVDDDDDVMEQLERHKRDNLIDARTIIECLANTPTNIYIATYPDICFPQPDNEVEDLIPEVPLRKKLNSVLGRAKVKYRKNCECCPLHWTASRSLSDCHSLTLNVMIHVAQFARLRLCLQCTALKY